MGSKFKDLGVRAISALIMAVIAGVPVALGGPWFVGLILFVIIAVIYEWVRMADPHASVLAYAVPMAGCGLSVLCAGFGNWGLALALVGLAAIAAGAERAKRDSLSVDRAAISAATEKVATDQVATDQVATDQVATDQLAADKAISSGVAWSGLGVLYLALPLLATIYVRGPESGLNSAGFEAFVFVLLSVIGADVGAYIGGSAIGGPKIAPKLSPKKTWAGFLSGLAFGGLVGISWAGFLDMPLYSALALTVPIIIFSVIGDFVESSFKRKLNVKDTGAILPGHGGVLDRIDALMFAMSFFALLILFFPNSWSV